VSISSQFILLFLQYYRIYLYPSPYQSSRNSSVLSDMTSKIWADFAKDWYKIGYFATENYATKNEHICSMCRKINKVGKQEVGIWWVQNRFPRYEVPIWSLWPNIRSQASYRYPISWEAFFDPSDSYFLFAKEQGYHRWALAHSSSCL
jgi:hypothetical protein